MPSTAKQGGAWQRAPPQPKPQRGPFPVTSAADLHRAVCGLWAHSGTARPGVLTPEGGAARSRGYCTLKAPGISREGSAQGRDHWGALPFRPSAGPAPPRTRRVYGRRCEVEVVCEAGFEPACPSNRAERSRANPLAAGFVHTAGVAARGYLAHSHATSCTGRARTGDLPRMRRASYQLLHRASYPRPAASPAGVPRRASLGGEALCRQPPPLPPAGSVSPLLPM